MHIVPLAVHYHPSASPVIQKPKFEEPNLQGQRAKKGIFITTGSFSKEAQEFISKIDTKIVLIDGKELVELMIDHNVGVSIVRSVEIKKMDFDYFEEPA